MGDVGIDKSRVAALLGLSGVLETKPPRGVPWPFPYGEPADVAALYDACDGLVLEDGVRLFGRGELHDVTRWLVLEKGLAWADDLVIVGERRDVVIVLDLDVKKERSGGGVLEVGSDDLEAFERVASEVVGYLSVHAEGGHELVAPPEVAARRASSEGDAAALEREITRPFYPGQQRLFVSLCIQLGGLWARAGESERAIAAFARSVDARIGAAGRGSEIAERKAGWRAAAYASLASGSQAIADECERRARSS